MLIGVGSVGSVDVGSVVGVILAGRILSQWSSASRGESGERSRANGIISAWRPPVTIRDGRL